MPDPAFNAVNDSPRNTELRRQLLERARAIRGHNAPVSTTGVSRTGDRVDLSAEAARAGAELARQLRSLREAFVGAAESARGDGTLKGVQEELDRGAADLERAAGGTPKRRGEGGTFRTLAGGVLLDARWNSIDLDGINSKLTLEVKGASGSKVLNFASGTSLSSIAAAVNSYFARTGVGAEYAPDQGVVFRRVGPTGYTSISVLDTGGLVNGGFSLVP